MITMASGKIVPVKDLQVGAAVLGVRGPEKVTAILTLQAKRVELTLEGGTTVQCAAAQALLLPETKLTRRTALLELEYVEAQDALEYRVMTLKGAQRVVKVETIESGRVTTIVTDGLHTHCADGLWCIGEEI